MYDHTSLFQVCSRTTAVVHKKPSSLQNDFLNVFVFVHLNDQKPQADIFRASQLEWKKDCINAEALVYALGRGRGLQKIMGFVRP